MNKNNLKKGNVLTLAVLVFTMASLALSLGIVTPIVKHVKNLRGTTYSRQSFYTAESLQEDILYRLKKNLTISPIENLALGSSTAEASITGSQEKIITINSDDRGFKRKIITKMIQGEGASFSYGVQTGLGGFEINNNATVNGNVYANGDITGEGTITGDAISATVPNPIADQINVGDANPPYGIAFGGNSTPKDVAQSFKVSTTTPISSIHLYVKKSSQNPLNDTVIKIVNDSNGKPGGTVLGSVAMNASQVGTSYSFVELPFPTTFNLTQNTQYWIIIYSETGTFGDNYSIGATSGTYANGKAMIGNWSVSGGDWSDTSPIGLDIYFRLYTSGKIGKISGVNILGTAWANTVEDSADVTGVKYCKVGTNCNTERQDPVFQGYPLQGGNITDWQADALLGGIQNGNLEIIDVQTLGPKKILGNLTVNGTLNLSGTIWVTGDFIVGNTREVRLVSNYGSNSGIIIVDGITDLGNGVIFSGSGSATSSYVMVVSNSTCDGSNCNGKHAVYVSNNAGAVILNAQKGSVFFKNNSGAKSVTANKIVMQQGAIIVYDKGLIDVNFSSGPSGSWVIDSWRESTD